MNDTSTPSTALSARPSYASPSTLRTTPPSWGNLPGVLSTRLQRLEEPSPQDSATLSPTDSPIGVPMKFKMHTNDEPVPEVIPKPVPMPVAAFNTPAPPVQPQPVKKPPSPELEPEIMQLKDSKFVRVTAKDVKNQTLPAYLQLELDLNPLKEGENISADRDSSIRHTGKP